MKASFILLALPLLVCMEQVQAQSSVEQVLASVTANNTTLKAQTQFREAQKADLKTGLSPVDPMVGFDYMIGSPATAGNQVDLTLTQVLDFPTVYARRLDLAEYQGRQAQWQVEGTRREILLQAKQTCIDLVYHNKLQAQLLRRSARTTKLREDFQAKMDKGEGNILDLNKARLQDADLRMRIQENQSALQVLQAKLAALNGGGALPFPDTVYPGFDTLGNFEALERETEANDPGRILLEQQINIGEQELALSKALKLPKLEVGYHYQGILGQSYNGLHTGLSLPLWEHRNTVEARQAAMAMNSLELQDHLNAHYHEIKELHGQYLMLGQALREYQALLGELDTEALLAKSLALGQISVITYFLEQGYYHDAHDKLLALERQYHQVVAELLKHRL